MGRIVPWVFFIYLAAAMLLDSDRDTLHISGSLFVVAATMCGVAFSYGRALPDESKLRAEVVLAGEHLFQSMSMFLLASLMKYGSIDIPKQMALLVGSPAAEQHFFGFAFTAVAFVFFFAGLLGFQAGYRTLAAVTIYRMAKSGNGRPVFASIDDERRSLEKIEKDDRLSVDQGTGASTTGGAR